MARFEQDYAAGDAYQAALTDYAEGTAWFGVSAVPAVIFNEKVSLVGAVPIERYRAHPRLDPRRRARRPAADSGGRCGGRRHAARRVVTRS